jgi:hypothetical protein
MGKFEDQLLCDLMREHGPALAVAERPAPVRRGVSRPVVAAGVVAAVGAVVAGVAVFGGSPAYAVTKNGDGTVTLSMSDVRAIDPANAELARLGVPVRAVPIKQGCTDTYEQRQPEPWEPLTRWEGNLESITIEVDRIPPGTTVIVGAGGSPDGTTWALADGGAAWGALPTCLPWRGQTR